MSATPRLPLCFACGCPLDQAVPGCDHAFGRDGRLEWVRAPWRVGLGDVIGKAAFTLLYIGALIGVPALLWWLATGWSLDGWLEIGAAIGFGLVMLPGVVIALGLLGSLHELRVGRRWDLRDAAAAPGDRAEGFVYMRGGEVVRGGVARHTRGPVRAPDDAAAWTSRAAADGEPAQIVAAAIAGLLARGELTLERVGVFGWSRGGAMPPAGSFGQRCEVRAAAAPDGARPIVEDTLLTLIARDREADLAAVCERLAVELAYEVGRERDEDGRWSGPDAPGGPAAALRAQIGPEPAGERDLAALLAGWRARDPEGAAAVLAAVRAVDHAFAAEAG